ncbi:hydroxyacid dehydrogenase [Haladaptatus sp. R4]|uniref:D-2-hydroxyacid dehydrogenase n=1 Tax=Haladaptatus sp. R4 TaxID=1679489 RepID=UPI0007B4EC3C|nr:D-2-hydroxyacid dehydrogenase [Haladaptatus sp. R4]KZN23862.1 hydroxyacid dehydrogenase [Haladaptatus sp. R4]
MTDAETGSEAPTVLVLSRGTHGMPMSDYVAELRERLPNHEIVRARTPEEEREYIVDAEIVTGLEIDEALISCAENLQLFAAASAGTGHLPLDALESRGVAVTNASGVHGPNIAEHVIGAILTFTRNFLRAERQQEHGEWRHFQAHELQGSTVTIVGLGAIGRAIAERLDGFGVETIGVRYSPEKGGPTDEVVGFDGLHDALSRTEYLVLACPLTPETRGLIGTAEFSTLPPNAVLVNIARGKVVETDALVSALRGNAIRGAALDVTDPEPLPEDHSLWNFDNVLITPHMAGHTPKYFARLADILAENVEHVTETGSYDDLRNAVR